MPHRLVLLIATFATSLGLLLPVSALADPRYEVMNAPEGVYWRSEPNWAAAERVSGFGVYNGTIIEVHCYQSGTAVEGSADTMWEQATDVGGRGYGSGWVNEHFINDGQPINQPSPGVGPCNPPPPPHEEAPPPPVEEHPSGGLIFPIFNAEGGIYYRNSPHWADTPQTPGIGVYNGDQVQLICGAFGDAVGPFNDTAWSYVNNLSRSVGSGWVDEHFINDGAPDNAFVSGEPMCGPETPGISGSRSGGGSGSGGNGGGANPPPGPAGVSFNRSAAVAWAEAHAKDTPPYHSACTWFVSQALWAGGLPQSSTWNGYDKHRSSIRNLQGTLTAWTTPLFVSYIKQIFPHSTFTRLDLRKGHTDVPAAEPGDVILYDWNGKSTTRNWSGLDHAALVIDDAKGSQYPEVAEWGADDFLWWGGAVKYKKRGWTWSVVSHKWLQEEHRNMRAFLLHIDTSG